MLYKFDIVSSMATRKRRRTARKRERRTYTMAEIAEKLDINILTAYREAHRGTFPCIQLSKKILVFKAACDAWYQASITRGKGAAA